MIVIKNTMYLNIRVWSFNKSTAKHRTLTHIVSRSNPKQWIIMHHSFDSTIVIPWSAYINAIPLSYWENRFSWRAALYTNCILNTKWLEHQKVTHDFRKDYTSAFLNTRYKGCYRSNYDWKCACTQSITTKWLNNPKITRDFLEYHTCAF